MKLIQLTQGQVALVDDGDFDYINKYKWFVLKGRYTSYARTKIKNKIVAMHGLILDITGTEMFSDHIDHNGLNNQRSNLRVATRSENSKNRTSAGKSKYLGVTLKAQKIKYINKNGEIKVYLYPPQWRSRIQVNGKEIHLGYFKTEIDAANKYDEVAKIYHKEFANLNFKL